MAIDAKDQVTHGHIRRVQLHATNLARQVGVRDEKLLKAVEAAALLHDMGKLAVPEYILNKPGKLTAAEFEKMKLHASVGADILSAIEFPYPVVPIVRHHHENWDGTGYPAGLKGTDIPIGARILSVVDCFDALTSDRPYRPKLSDEEALAILIERRGTMYDPLIVDTFAKVHAITPKELAPIGPPREVLNTIAHSRRTARPEISELPDEVSASADEMLSVYELSQALAGHVSVGDAGDVIAKHLRRLIPSSLCIFYLYDQQSNELYAAHVAGEGASLIQGLRMPLGQRLSGWVAANRQTIFNSDAVLDLADVARLPLLRLKTCLSTPLVWREHLIGVLSVYSTQSDNFNDDHRRIIEFVAPQIAHTFRRAIEVGNSPRRDALTGLPHADQLESLIHAASESNRDTCNALVAIDLREFKQITAEYGRPVADEVLQHVARHARAGLRVADILFRNGADDFVAFLPAADAETADAVASRIRERINRNPVTPSAGLVLNVQATVTTAVSPRDGIRLRDLLATAKRRKVADSRTYEGPSVH
jgi:diguanylate cyclase (GGDEF)-like protein/putative nucleotidyltransferase with HDIG domain